MNRMDLSKNFICAVFHIYVAQQRNSPSSESQTDDEHQKQQEAIDRSATGLNANINTNLVLSEIKHVRYCLF